MSYNGPSEDIANLTEIRIGWFGPDSDDDPRFGDAWWAANLAVREANEAAAGAKSGFDALPVKLVPRWAADPWKSGVSLLARMIFNERPLALIGSVDSASTHLAEQIVAKANLTLVSPFSTDKTATLAGVSWMFSCAPDSAAVARVLAGPILAELKAKGGKLVLLATTDHESRMLIRDLMSELSRRDRLPDLRVDLTPGKIDFSEAVRKVCDAKPTVVLLIAGPDDAAQLTKGIRENLGNETIFGGPSLGMTRFVALAGLAAEGLRFPLLFDRDAGDAATAKFVERFVAERRHQPDFTAAMAYDATRLLVGAIRSAGPNLTRIRDTIARGEAWKGVAGTIHFDGTGQNNRAHLHLGTIRNGAVMPLDTPGGSSSNRNNSK